MLLKIVVDFLGILTFKVSPYVTAFYDAFTVYGQVLKETIEADQDYNDANEINQRMWNRTFDGEFKLDIQYWTLNHTCINFH